MDLGFVLQVGKVAPPGAGRFSFLDSVAQSMAFAKASWFSTCCIGYIDIYCIGYIDIYIYILHN